MKKITATIKPSQLDSVQLAIAPLDWVEFLVAETKQFGIEGESLEVYRGLAYVIDFASTLTVEVVVKEHDVDVLLNSLLYCVPLEERAAFYYQIESVEKCIAITPEKPKLAVA